MSLLPVLVVEDDPVFQDTFARIFSRICGDWQIYSVQDGASALKALENPDFQFRLALIDIGLPDISGIDVISEVHKRFSDLPILVTTMFTAQDTFFSAIRAGARGYLLKGDTDLSLASSIEQVIRGEYPVSPALARYLFRLAGSPTTASAPNNLQLTNRELELLQYLAKGNSYASCSRLMKISLSTVQTHIRNMYRKLDVSNHRQAINKAQSSGLLHF